MARLPFLVVHGEITWKMLLVVLVVASYGIGYAIRRRRQVRRMRAQLAQLEISNLKAGPVAFRARVRAANGAELECDGQIVEVAGPVIVEHGSKARGGWQRGRGVITRTIAIGDEVVASGTLVEGPVEPSTYREAKTRWQAGEVRVFATKPHAKPRPLDLAQHVGALLALSFIWYGTLHLIGSRALARAEDQAGKALDGYLPALGAAEVAAAMPGSHDNALYAIARELANHGHPRSERSLELLLGLKDLEGECPAKLLLKAVRLEDALAAGRRCDHDVVAPALAFLGRFAEAERELAANDTSDLATTIHLATGNWNAAALGADARAHQLETEDPTQFRTPNYLRNAAATVRCLAALYRSNGGDHEAFAKLTDRGTDTACAVIEAASRPVAEQAAALVVPSAHEITDSGYRIDADQISVAAGGAPKYFNSGTSALLFDFPSSRIWLAPFQLAAHPDDSTTSSVETSMVAYEALRGELAEARKHLARVTTPYEQESLEVALTLREGGPIKTTGDDDIQSEGIKLRNRIVDNTIQRYLDEDGIALRANLTRAANGDGDGLVAALQEEYLQWHAFTRPLLGVLPNIKTHREAAISALRMFRDDIGFFTDHIPFSSLTDYCSYRDIARLIGDEEEAKRWQTIIDRFVVVLADRQRVIALMFWRE